MVADPESKPGEIHVLIIGAGITGLLIAQGLKQAGIKYTIFESETQGQYRPREWGMTIHWSVPLLMELLPPNLKARINEAYNDPSRAPTESDAMQIYNMESGALLKAVPMPKCLRVSRRKLRTLSAEGIEVQYGKTLVEVVNSPTGGEVKAVFADETSTIGTVIVGADGPSSKVRQILVGKDKAQTDPVGIVLYNVVTKFDTPEKALFARKHHPLYYAGMHPQGLATWISTHDVPDPEKPETWSFQLMPSWLGERDKSLSNADRLKIMKEKSSLFEEPFKSLFNWLPEDAFVGDATIATWTPIPWDNKHGTLTIAGDAAHPVPPHRGQGLNLGIKDAYEFVAAIKAVRDSGVSLSDSISKYDEGVVKRGADEVPTSRKNALSLHDFKGLMQSALLTQGVSASTAVH